MSNDALASALSRLLANVSAFAHKAHGYHWNVTGPHFPEYHGLFDAIYSDAQGSLDPLAENVRKLGAFPPATITDLAARSVLSATDERGDVAMLANLLMDNDTLLSLIHGCIGQAKDDNHQGILNFLAERQDMHQKWSWQLRATLGMTA